MTKRLFVILIASLVATSMTACGNNAAATSTSAPETTEQYVESQGEGPVQGGIKSDEEIAALQAEEAEYASEETTDTTEYAENIDNTGHEPEAYGSGNFQDYWQGEDYFDLEGYLRDVGCTKYEAGCMTGDGFTTETNDTPNAYRARYNDWAIVITSNYACIVDHIPSDSSIPLYTLHTDISLESHMVTVNSQGSLISEGVLQTLCKAINSITMHGSENDPFQYDFEEATEYTKLY